MRVSQQIIDDINAAMAKKKAEKAQPAPQLAEEVKTIDEIVENVTEPKNKNPKRRRRISLPKNLRFRTTK